MFGFFSAFSSMGISFQGTKNGNNDDLNLTYNVIYTGPTYKVSVTVLLNGATTPLTVWIQPSGNIVAFYDGSTQKNYTGSGAINDFLAYFSDLENLQTFALLASTNTAGFHATGTSTATIGKSSFLVTNYVANTTPETVQICNTETVVLNAYNVNVGTPTGSGFEIVSSATFSAIETTSTGTTTLDYTYLVTALTVA